ncbi:hypothetical protein ABPG77_003915 [Micractinium sp. CCAP 211/92]
MCACAMPPPSAAALAALAFFGFRPGRGWLRNKAARGEAVAADALESGGKGAPPDSPGGEMPAGTDTFLHSASIKQQLPGSGTTEPAVDTFIQAKGFGPESALLATEQQPPVVSAFSSVASGSRGPPTPPAGAAAITSAIGSDAGAATIPRAQRSASSQPTSSSSLEGDALLSIIASHLFSRQPGRQQGLQRGPGSGDSAAAAAQLGSAVQGWEVAWGDIEVERLVGRGAFGMVYLGRWNELPVAVKILMMKDGLAKQGLELPAGIMRALQQEASVMARMRHPHVVSFLGLCTMPPAILTEYCPRGSVYENLQEGLHSPAAAAELTWRRRLSMAHDAAMGLLYLHRRGLIHRDIKSPNLLVTENWRVQVSDFNLAKLLGPAPEVVQGGKASAASDVFSFGMIARQLREGLRPEVPPPDALPGQGMTTAPGLDAYCQLMRECWAQSEEGRPTFADIVPRLRTLLEQS